MASFTIALKDVIRLTGGTTEIVNGIRKLTGGNIGLDAYPIFDPDYKDILNGKIVDHFWNREIGLETIDMFQLAIRRKMNLMMPFYNKIYLSTMVEFDPLSTISIKTVNSMEGTVANTSNDVANSSAENDGKSRSVSSATPQTMLKPNEDYATGAADSNSQSTAISENTQNSEFTSDTENNGESETKGYQGLASELLARYRASLVNTDLLVLDELEECFMQLWDTGDSYTNNYYGGLI